MMIWLDFLSQPYILLMIICIGKKINTEKVFTTYLVFFPEKYLFAVFFFWEKEHEINSATIYIRKEFISFN